MMAGQFVGPCRLAARHGTTSSNPISSSGESANSRSLCSADLKAMCEASASRLSIPTSPSATQKRAERCSLGRIFGVAENNQAYRVQRPSDQPTAHPDQPFVVSPLIPHRLRPTASCPVSCRKRSSGAVAARCIARPTIAASSADSQPHPWKNHRPPGEGCRGDVVQLAPVGEREVEPGDRIAELGLRVRRQVLMRTMTASSRELQAASTASLADSARLATCGRTLSPPPAMKGSHGSHRPHAAPPWEGRSAGRRSAWDDCGKARRPPADPGPSPGRWR